MSKRDEMKFRFISDDEMERIPYPTSAVQGMANMGDVMAITGNDVAGYHAAVQHLLDAFATATYGFLGRRTAMTESVFISSVHTPDIASRNSYIMDPCDEKAVRSVVERHLPVGLIVLNTLDRIDFKSIKWAKSYANEIDALIAIVGDKMDDATHADVDAWIECNYIDKKAVAELKKVRNFAPISGQFEITVVGGYR